MYIYTRQLIIHKFKNANSLYSDNGCGNSNNERAMKFVVEIVGSQLHGKGNSNLYDKKHSNPILEGLLLEL